MKTGSGNTMDTPQTEAWVDAQCALLGLTLAIGVVIDDAIIVLENIERHREGG